MTIGGNTGHRLSMKIAREIHRMFPTPKNVPGAGMRPEEIAYDVLNAVVKPFCLDFRSEMLDTISYLAYRLTGYANTNRTSPSVNFCYRKLMTEFAELRLLAWSGA